MNQVYRLVPKDFFFNWTIPNILNPKSYYDEIKA